MNDRGCFHHVEPERRVDCARETARVKDILGHENFASVKSHLKLEIVDLKDAHRRFHPREQEEGRNVDGPSNA